MNQIFLYDGTFLSLIQLIDYFITHHIRPFQIKNEQYQPTLFDEVIHLELNYSSEFYRIFIEKIGTYCFHKVFYVFLSEEENKELILYYFLLNAYKNPNIILKLRNLKCVSEVLRISFYVAHESHKMKGFLRFKELKSKVLYAEVSPTNNVLCLITEHFQKRLKNEFWIIKDFQRDIYALYDKQQVSYVRGDEFILEETDFSAEEAKIENLWKIFYQTTGIKERKNDRCRMNFMPKKYWQFITEVRDEL